MTQQSTSIEDKTRRSLVLSGGGARGAYQAGVLKAITEIALNLGIKKPFDIYTGVSAGAINAAFYAGYTHNIKIGMKNLEAVWLSLTPKRVFKTGALAVGESGLNWLTSLTLGGLYDGHKARNILNTEPLKELLNQTISQLRIKRNLKNGHFDALAISATKYETAETITFVQSRETVQMWHRGDRRSELAVIQPKHILASSAIPIFFSPVYLGGTFYGDGCLRNVAPLSPAVHLGAQKILAIGVKSKVSPQDKKIKHLEPTIARVIGVILDGVFLDNMDLDVERLLRLNNIVTMMKSQHQSAHSFRLKPIHLTYIQPSVDLGQLAGEKSQHLPKILKHLIKGMGSMEEAAEIISYLLFDPSYCNALIEIGYKDGLSYQKTIEEFLTVPYP